MRITEKRKQPDNQDIYKRKLRKLRLWSGVDLSNTAHKYDQHQWWVLVNITEFRMKKYKGTPSYMRNRKSLSKDAAPFSHHTAVTNRQFVKPTKVAVSVVYRKCFDNLHTMSTLILMLVESRDFSVFYAFIATKTELSDWLKYSWPTIKYNSPFKNKTHAS
jgi:hypothetical protein